MLRSGEILKTAWLRSGMHCGLVAMIGVVCGRRGRSDLPAAITSWTDVRCRLLPFQWTSGTHLNACSTSSRNHLAGFQRNLPAVLPMDYGRRIVLFALILHGLMLDRNYRAKRWLEREPHSARIVPINTYLARQVRRR